MNNKLLNITNSFLVLICLISLFGGLVYRVYALNNLGVAISLTLAIISFIIIQYFYFYANKKIGRQAEAEDPDLKLRAINFWLFASYLLLLIAAFYILLNHRTANSIISPWQVVPNYFLVIYGLATLCLIANIIINGKFSLPLIVAHYFLSFSVALIVYRLGYGYDSFIHLTTENLIDKVGAVLPKPFYYLGQYGLLVNLHKITTLPLAWLDKLLLPVLAAVFLPVTLWQALTTWFNEKRLSLILILTSLALTFPFLIVTTPQNLAYFLLIIIILLGLTCKSFYDFFTILLLALTALIIQPIAGLPALLFCLFLAVYHSDRSKIKKFAYPLLIAITLFILPASFYFLNRQISSAAANDTAVQTLNQLALNIPGQENFILNFAYLYGFNLKFILILLALSGMVIALRHKEQCKVLWLYFTLAASLFISYLIASKIPFAFLIDYERSDYPERILLIACLFLLPFMIIAIYALIEKIAKQNIFIKLSFAVFLTLLITASLYLTYPRYDNYFNSRGYSVSSSDLKAVSWINGDAKNDFIVLANQQISAAALDQFGFKKYYSVGQNQLFYYPVPTSSPLYQSYLDMVYKTPSRETMSGAMNLAGVREGYFVLNKYWWAFKKILDEAKLSADSWQEIDNGEVYVFKYERK